MDNTKKKKAAGIFSAATSGKAHRWKMRLREDGAIERLVPHPEDIGYRRATYHELRSEPVTVYKCELSGEARPAFKAMSIAWPEDITVKRHTMQRFPQEPLKPDELSLRQIYALDQAVGVQSSWWPLDGFSWSAREHFAHSVFYVAYRSGKPIGVAVLEPVHDEKGTATLIAMIGLVQQEQGKGIGGRLLDFSIKKAMESTATERVLLTTSSRDLMRGRDGQPVMALSLYQKKGFSVANQFIDDPKHRIEQAVKEGDVRTADMFQSYVPEDYVHHPETGFPLKRFGDEELMRRLHLAFADKSSRL